jgi:hypothetical protein
LSPSGIVAYQVTEILDEVICPVCEVMHGKSFEVAREHAKLEQVLRLRDPEALKSVAPWPKQGRPVGQGAALKLRSRDPGARLGSPPYHPLWRGQLVPIGKVGEIVPVLELVVDQEVAPPPLI